MKCRFVNEVILVFVILHLHKQWLPTKEDSITEDSIFFFKCFESGYRNVKSVALVSGKPSHSPEVLTVWMLSFKEMLLSLWKIPMQGLAGRLGREGCLSQGLNSIPGTQAKMEREHKLHKVVLWLPHARTHTHHANSNSNNNSSNNNDDDAYFKIPMQTGVLTTFAKKMKTLLKIWTRRK